MMSYSILLSLFISLHLHSSNAHPGGFTQGRASCGSEYSTLNQAFEIFDIAEAWYVRRLSTCSSPYLWTTFETTTKNQEVYVAANIPEIARFNDNLKFNGILFGPGLIPTTSEIAVPKDIKYPVLFNGQKITQKTLTNVDIAYNNCDFVTNVVMKQYAKIKNGRCTETIRLDADYKDALVADVEYSSEWLYSVDHTLNDVGRYWILTWLTDRSTGKLSNGKYDVTLAPWTWSKYADADTQKKVQAQATTCQCSFNALEWREATLSRLSNVPEKALIQALPKTICSTSSSLESSTCHGAIAKNKLSTDTEIEWSGKFKLVPGSKYTWNFYASTGCVNKKCTTSYPDPAIEVLVVAANLISSEMQADTIMKSQNSNTVLHQSAINIGDGGNPIPLKSILTMNTIGATDTTMVTSFEINVPTNGQSTYWMYTQHVPHEFSANFLTCTSGACVGSSSTYVYPTDTSLYLGTSKYVNEWKNKLEKVETSDGTYVSTLTPSATSNGNVISRKGLGFYGWMVVVVVFLVV